MNSDVLLGYVRAQQVAPQWQGFLLALSSELSNQADDSTLRTLFYSIGVKLAADAQNTLSQVDTLAALQQGLNAYWGGMQWGWVEMAEVSGFVELTHYLAPLAQGLGDEALVWSVGLLEGFYHTVFQALGADPSLQLRYVQEPGDGLSLRFRFGRA